MDTTRLRGLLLEKFPGLAEILPGCAIARNGGAATSYIMCIGDERQSC